MSTPKGIKMGSNRKPDFSGWATRNDLECSDGRVIRRDAFAHNDGKKVPLVWQHIHGDINNVVGHALLKNKSDGVYCLGFLNNTPQADVARDLLLHGDIDALSIFANKLKQQNNNVIHGDIVEVSLVLSGANPGAFIENVSIQHSDGTFEDVAEEAIIHDLFSISDIDEEDDIKEENTMQDVSEDVVKHEDAPKESSNAGDDRTVEDIVNSMTEEQRTVLGFLIAQAVDAATADDDEYEDEDTPEGDNVSHSNVFDRSTGQSDAFYTTENGDVLSHSDIEMIAADIVNTAREEKMSLKDVIRHAAKEYGISNPEILFPNAKLTGKPTWIKPEDDWVPEILDGVSHTPFARLKSMQIDLTEEKLRAKGYITADQKKDGVMKALSRETTPQTIYIRSKLDRDDIIDVTEHDLVAYTREALRIKFRAELARAILVGDGRELSDREKIKEEHVRPIYSENDLYATKHVLPATVKNEELPDKILRSQKNFKGHGRPYFFTTYDIFMDMLLAKDEADSNRRLYKNEEELAAALRVSKIVVVDALEGLKREKGGHQQDLIGILVNPSDYTIGRDKGGEITSFENFDIDFNQYKYLMESRLSGALTEPKTAIVIERLQA